MHHMNLKDLIPKLILGKSRAIKDIAHIYCPTYFLAIGKKVEVSFCSYVYKFIYSFRINIS